MMNRVAISGIRIVIGYHGVGRCAASRVSLQHSRITGTAFQAARPLTARLEIEVKG
jgi:hypothetical protein